MHHAVLALLVLTPPLTAQTTWFVDVNGVPPGTGTALDPYTSIDFAIAQPSTLAGDLVLVFPGTYQETVLLDKGLTLMSTDGPGSTVIDAGGAGSALRLAFTGGFELRVEGFTLRGGTGTLDSGVLQGGGLHAGSVNGVLARCVIEGNVAEKGGGVYTRNSSLQLLDCTLRDNLALSAQFAPEGGGLFAFGGTTTLKRCAIEGNAALDPASTGVGGGAYGLGNGAVDLAGCRIVGNEADYGGGLAGGVVASGCRIARNRAQAGGGAVGFVDLTDCLIEDNVSRSPGVGQGEGGGAAHAGTFTQCTLRGNVAHGQGAGVYGGTLVGCRIEGNRALPGTGPGLTSGGVDASTLYDCLVSENVAVGGPPFFLASGGGAASSSLVDCDVLRNRCESLPIPGIGQGGGGLYASQAVRCRIAHNEARLLGGGALSSNLTSCEVYDNRARFGGGAVDGTLRHCTISGNHAAAGSGLYALTTSGMSVEDSIVWDDDVALYPNGSMLTIEWSDVLGGWPGVGNIDADPLFWDAAAGDFHLMANSPCIDAGNPASPPDPDGSRADMGAHPFDPNYTGP